PTPAGAIESEPRLGAHTLTAAWYAEEWGGELAPGTDPPPSVDRAWSTDPLPRAAVSDPVATGDCRNGGRRASICGCRSDAGIPVVRLCDPSAPASPRHGAHSLGGGHLRRIAIAWLCGGCGPGAHGGGAEQRERVAHLHPWHGRHRIGNIRWAQGPQRSGRLAPHTRRGRGCDGCGRCFTVCWNRRSDAVYQYTGPAS